MVFKDSYADSTSGESFVIITHRKKEYNGKARLHPDDKWSNYTGCRYAEERAEIKALKDEWKQKKASCEECRKFVAAVGQYATFDKTSPSAKAMFRQLNRRIKEVNNLADIITKKELNLQIAIKQQDEFHNKIKRIKLNNNEEN